jgi:hypothetical protein
MKNVTNPHTATRTPFYNSNTGTDLPISDVPAMPGYEISSEVWSGNQRPFRCGVYFLGELIGTTNGCGSPETAARAGYAIAVKHAKADKWAGTFEPADDPNAWKAEDDARMARRRA